MALTAASPPAVAPADGVAGEPGPAAADGGGAQEAATQRPAPGAVRSAAGIRVPGLRGSRVGILLASVLINLLGIGLPIFILQIYDRVLPQQAENTLLILSSGLLAILLADFVLRVCRTLISSWNGACLEHLTRCAAMRTLLHMPLGRYEQTLASDYLEQFTAIGDYRDFYASQLLTALVDLPFALLFLWLIWYLGGLLLLPVLVVLAAFTGVALVIGLSLRRQVRARVLLDQRRYDRIIEVLSQVQAVKALALGQAMTQRLNARQELSSRAFRDVTALSILAQNMSALMGQASTALTVGIGAVLVMDGALSVGQLAACTLLASRAIAPLQTVLGLWTTFQTVQIARRRVDQLLAMPQETDGRARPNLPPVRGAIDLEDVSFAYPGAEHPVLEHVDLSIPAGACIAVEGDPVSGRTTLLLLMLGLLQPQSDQGRVLIDGQDIRAFDPASVRRQIAYLPQVATVFRGTIMENLTLFRSGEYINEVLYITHLLGLDAVIKRLPSGYDTVIGQGVREVLPVGIRQRIAIARALCGRPRIILFDATNAPLDQASDRHLHDMLTALKGRVTMVIVSDRPSTLKLADQRVRLTDRRLVDLGPTRAETVPA